MNRMIYLTHAVVMHERKYAVEQLPSKLVLIISFAGSAILAAFGGWDTALATLLLFMAADYVTGLVVAGVFGVSPKSANGALESRAGWKGLCRKGVTLLIVLVAVRLDLIMASTVIRDGTVIAFTANETISIVENAGLMGAPIPAVITKAIDVLKRRAQGGDIDR